MQSQLEWAVEDKPLVAFGEDVTHCIHSSVPALNLPPQPPHLDSGCAGLPSSPQMNSLINTSSSKCLAPVTTNQILRGSEMRVHWERGNEEEERPACRPSDLTAVEGSDPLPWSPLDTYSKVLCTRLRLVWRTSSSSLLHGGPLHRTVSPLASHARLTDSPSPHQPSLTSTADQKAPIQRCGHAWGFCCP